MFFNSFLEKQDSRADKSILWMERFPVLLLYSLKQYWHHIPVFSHDLTCEELGESDGDNGDAAHVPVALVQASVRPGMIQVWPSSVSLRVRSQFWSHSRLRLRTLGEWENMIPGPESLNLGCGARISLLRGLWISLTCHICHKTQTEM